MRVWKRRRKSLKIKNQSKPNSKHPQKKTFPRYLMWNFNSQDCLPLKKRKGKRGKAERKNTLEKEKS